MKLSNAAAATAMFAAMGVIAAPDVTDAEVAQLNKEASAEGALKVARAIFLSEYCTYVSNNAPKHVPAYKVARNKQPVSGLPANFTAFEYSYNGIAPAKDSKPVDGYCGSVSVAGPKNPVISGQMTAFEALQGKAQALAYKYGAASIGGTADDADMAEAFMNLKSAAGEFQRAVVMGLARAPFNEAGKPNIAAISYSDARPLKGGETQVNKILDAHMEDVADRLDEAAASAGTPMPARAHKAQPV